MLNHIIHTMNKKDIEIVLITCFVLFSILPTITLNIFDPFDIKVGYSMIWLAILYLFGGYFKKYNIVSYFKRKTLILTYAICIIITWLSKLVVEVVTYNIFGIAKFGNLLIQYISPTILLSAISLFLFFASFKDIDSKAMFIIKYLSPASFGVYLIHTNPLIYEHIIKGSFVFLSNMVFIKVVIYAFIIFLICCLIDWIRLLVFKMLKINKISNISKLVELKLNSIIADIF